MDTIVGIYSVGTPGAPTIIAGADQGRCFQSNGSIVQVPVAAGAAYRIPSRKIGKHVRFVRAEALAAVERGPI